jgi:hypothetical protein
MLTGMPFKQNAQGAVEIEFFFSGRINFANDIPT